MNNFIERIGDFVFSIFNKIASIKCYFVGHNYLTCGNFTEMCFRCCHTEFNATAYTLFLKSLIPAYGYIVKLNKDTDKTNSLLATINNEFN